jgi:hypothetical protein
MLINYIIMERAEVVKIKHPNKIAVNGAFNTNDKELAS